MAVFTPVTADQAAAFLAAYDLGALRELHPIAEGVENSNFRLETEAGRYVLTLFERRTDAAALPFCLGLTDHLALAGRPAARPVRDRRGEWIATLNDRPAAIVAWVQGAWLKSPTPENHRQAGAELAAMHLAARDYGAMRPNPVGPAACRALAQRCRLRAETGDIAMLERLEAEVALWEGAALDLPRGAVHADYFPDNVLFQDGRVSGVIDFYFACIDVLAYDLAIALSAWTMDDGGRRDAVAFDAFLAGYQSVRPLAPVERQALPGLGAAACARFTLTRLHDRLFHDPTALVTPKDPMAFFRRLEAWSGVAI